MAKIAQSIKEAFAILESRANGYDRNTFLWGPEHGDPILAKDLTVSHLANIINWIMDHDKQYDESVLEFMIGEAKHRRLEAFASGEPYVVRGDDGNYLVLYP